MFESVGLILVTPRREEYWCTPTNSVTFATTGGDGVHFGWVDLPGRPIDAAPIVMTVPMADTPNLIVGQDVREFLCLGCRYGYFALEGLVHDPDGTLAEIATNQIDPERSDDDVALLTMLSTEFDLAPWPDPARRLQDLQVRYLPMLEVPPPPDLGSSMRS